jgi:hypothetical protein
MTRACAISPLHTSGERAEGIRHNDRAGINDWYWSWCLTACGWLGSKSNQY